MGNHISSLNDISLYDISLYDRESRVNPRYNWHPDVPDRRDQYVVHYPTDDDNVVDNTKLDDDIQTDVLRIDLRKQLPPIFDDCGLGCSTISTLSTLIEYHELQIRPHISYELSRLFWYYVVREMNGTIQADTGCSFRDAWRVLNREGVCSESKWPFKPYKYRIQPNLPCYEDGTFLPRFIYKRVPQTLEAIKLCLQQNKLVAFGLSVYDSFESPVTRRTGQIFLPGCACDLSTDKDHNICERQKHGLPEVAEDFYLGGHALVIVGYDDTQCGVFIVRNSHGPSWGANGYGYISYEYVLNTTLARDFWILDSDEPITEEASENEASENDSSQKEKEQNNTKEEHTNTDPPVDSLFGQIRV